MKNFEKYYREDIVPNLTKKYGNPMRVPRIEKIVINMGVADSVTDNKILPQVSKQLEKLSGQLPIITKARKSLAIFKLREGMPIGCKVTLRKQKAFHFLEKLILVALPRRRDFRGFTSQNFDKNGNFNFGLNSQVLFPEIDYDNIDNKLRGMNITIVTSTNSDVEAKELLQQLFFPFKH